MRFIANGEGTALQILKVSFIITVAVYSVILLVFCRKTGKMLKSLLLSAASGLFVFAMLNLFSGYTGVRIAVNVWTAGTSALFGAPGVVGILTINTFF